MGCRSRALRPLFLVCLIAALCAISGCRSWPGRPVVSAVEVTGADEVDTEPMLDGLATSETPLLLGLIPRVLEYATYDPAVLAKDLERVERFLRARGYYEAKVSAARVVRLDEHRVRVEIDVALGASVHVRRVNPAGLALLPIELAAPAVSSIRMREGDVFDEQKFADDKRALQRVLTDGGYAFAKVEAKAQVDIAKHAVDVNYSVQLGPRARYGVVRIYGLGEIPEEPVRATLDIRPGEPYSSADLEDGRKALVNLGVFASVEVTEDLTQPATAQVPITITLRPSKLRTVRLGGGMRFDVLRLSAHLRTGWEDRNLLGGMRRFSVDLRPGLTFFPTRVPTDNRSLEAPTRILPEFRLRTELRQPALFERRTAGFVSAEYSVYPVLYPLPEGTAARTEPILGYNEVKTAVGAERAFFAQRLTITPSYNWQAYFPFSYQGDAARALDPVRVSFPELLTILDFRDDPIQTTRGIYFSNSLQVAGYVFQGTVSDVRVRPEVRVYTQGALGRRSVFAARLAFGFLFPHDYAESLDPGSVRYAQAGLNPEDPEVVRDQQKLLLRAFYSGGPNSNRGYPLRGIGPHGPIGFLVPSNLSGSNCSLTQPDGSRTPIADLPSACIRPLGGLTLWELSLETRFPISGAFHGAIFVDASDLTREVGKLRFNVPHLSPGFGLRYLTPVGPLRLDLGFRPPYLQALGKRELSLADGRAGDGLFGIPVALDLAIGEAF
jgi:outer membrane protein assembly factor BamA